MAKKVNKFACDMMGTFTPLVSRPSSQLFKQTYQNKSIKKHGSEISNDPPCNGTLESLL